MATVVLQDLGKVISVPIGTATAFRGQINENFTVLKDASQQLQDMVGNWDFSNNGTINERLYKNSKLYIGTETQHKNDVDSGLQFRTGDIWFEVVE